MISTALVCLASSLLVSASPLLEERQSGGFNINVGQITNGLLTPLLPNNTFDYIVVGAGTAGLTIAARLSEDPNSRVAVIEAGDDYQANLITPIFANTPAADTIGVGASPLDTNSIDWNFVTAPQDGANNRKIHYARGKCLGGSSVRNFMIYQRGTSSSYDQWASLGNPGWGWNDLLPYFKKSCDFTPPTNLRQNTFPTNFNPDSMSPAGGPLQISYPNYAQQFSDYMGRSLNELGLPTATDFNSGTLDGATYSAATINPDDGYRSTSRTTFLKAAETRKNLVVYKKAQAKRILFQGTRAVGVTVSYAPSLIPVTAAFYATREVIVSAGAFQSPQLLMVSGIGPKAQLDAQNIPIISQLEGVGQGMQDHIFFTPTYPVAANITTFTKLANNPIFLAAEFLKFAGPNHPGIVGSNVADFLGWERLNSSVLSSIGAPSLDSYPAGWPHLEYLSGPGYIGDFSNLFAENLLKPPGSQFAGILAALVAPQSRGTVTITSADTAVLPTIDPRWLTDPKDQAVALYAYKRVRAAFNTQAMAPIRNGPEAYPGPQVQSDGDILNAIRNSLMTVWHAACTCAMLPQSAGGVLDPTMSVYGVTALRVVDASSFPMLPPGHPQSTVYAIAEKVADLVKAANQ